MEGNFLGFILRKRIQLMGTTLRARSNEVSVVYDAKLSSHEAKLDSCKCGYVRIVQGNKGVKYEVE